jgi:hypothetical protein
VIAPRPQKNDDERSAGPKTRRSRHLCPLEVANQATYVAPVVCGKAKYTLENAPSGSVAHFRVAAIDLKSRHGPEPVERLGRLHGGLEGPESGRSDAVPESELFAATPSAPRLATRRVAGGGRQRGPWNVP